MILSETKVRSPVVSFSLETENTNPIHTTIRAQFGTQSYSGSPSFGGPVTLTERGNNAFTLEYSRRSSQYSNLLTSPVNYVKDGLKLSIERLDEDKSLCRDAELGEINLEPIIEMFQHLASDVSKYSINLGSLGQ